MLEQFTDTDPLRNDDFKLPADGVTGKWAQVRAQVDKEWNTPHITHKLTCAGCWHSVAFCDLDTKHRTTLLKGRVPLCKVCPQCGHNLFREEKQHGESETA